MNAERNARRGQKAVRPPVKAPAAKKRIDGEMLQYYSLLIPVLALIFVFCYIPMYGIVIAFQDYLPGSPFIGEGVRWVGLKYFERFIGGEYFTRLIRNTLVLSGLNLAFGFSVPILFALLMDQIKTTWLKKTIQTASYMPYFISSVVVAGMVISFIDTDGLVMQLLSVFGVHKKIRGVDRGACPRSKTVTNAEQSIVFGRKLYFCNVSSSVPGEYEAEDIDGANQ